MVADELRRQADNFIELNDLAPGIARVHHGQQLDLRDGSLGHTLCRMASEDDGAVESGAVHAQIIRFRRI